jgi:hypothetical protein
MRAHTSTKRGDWERPARPGADGSHSRTRSRKRATRTHHGAAADLRVCDFCGSAFPPFERQRLIWDNGTESGLVLAELCRRCAADADRLLDRYGGHGRSALRLTREHGVAASPVQLPRLVRLLVYLLVALASFFLVTLISSLR